MFWMSMRWFNHGDGGVFAEKRRLEVLTAMKKSLTSWVTKTAIPIFAK